MDIAAMMSIVSALDGGGDAGKMVPESDADDFRKGARYIQDEWVKRFGLILKSTSGTCLTEPLLAQILSAGIYCYRQ